MAVEICRGYSPVAQWNHRPSVLQEFGPMVLASGGFGADFGSDSLLATYRPDLLHLPTTNGEHCTGVGLQGDIKHLQIRADFSWNECFCCCLFA